MAVALLRLLQQMAALVAVALMAVPLVRTAVQSTALLVATARVGLEAVQVVLVELQVPLVHSALRGRGAVVVAAELDQQA